MRSLGCARFSKSHKLRASHFGAIGTFLAGAVPAYPTTASLLPLAPSRRFDQGTTSSCGGNAVPLACYVSLAAAGTPLDFVPSQQHCYSASLCEEQPGDGPLRDTGVEPADPINVVARVGLLPMGPLALDGRYSDVTTENVTLRPTADQDAVAAKNLAIGAYSLYPSHPDFAAQAATCIGAKRVALAICIFVDSAFQAWGDYSNSPSITRPLDGVANLNDPNGGGHYVVCLGYRVESNGAISFLLCNSWSSAWGVGGCIWVTEKWLRSSCSEAYALDVRVREEAAS